VVIVKTNHSSQSRMADALAAEEGHLRAAVTGTDEDIERAVECYVEVLDHALRVAPSIAPSLVFEIRQVGGNEWGPLFLAQEETARLLAVRLRHLPAFGPCWLRRLRDTEPPQMLLDLSSL
jgi:hypothetical protein